MPQRTIYVNRDLDEQVRRHRLDVSSICQRALARQARLAERRHMGRLPQHPTPDVKPTGNTTGGNTAS